MTTPGLAGAGVAALLGLAAGNAAQLQQPALWPLGVYMLLGLAGAVLMGVVMVMPERGQARRARITRRRGRWVWVWLGAALAGFALVGLRALAYQADRLAPALEGRDIEVVGIVATLPQPSDTGLRFVLAPESARLAGEAVRLPARIQLGWYGGLARDERDARPDLQSLPPPLRAGERWRLTLRLKAPHGSRNPHGFDYELWLWEQGVQATGYVRNGLRDPPPVRLGSTWRHPVEQARQRLRDAIVQQVADPRSAGVLAALVVGDQRAIERADWDLFRATGVAHLMSISGLHVTMFAWLAVALIGALWRCSARGSPQLCLRCPAPTAALLGGLLLAAAYALFSGWGVPAQRTVWMLGAVTLLRLSGRRWPWGVVWLLALGVVIVIDPWAMLQAGFWLSFVAVGVLFVTDARADSQPADGGRRKLLSRLGQLLREQWTVSLALAPLALLLFQQVSLIGLLANLLAIPWVTLLVTPLAMLGALWPPLWSLAAAAVQAMLLALQGFAALPWATLSLAAPPWPLGLAALLGACVLVLRAPLPLRLLGLPLLLPVLLWQPPRPAAGGFDLLAADVGQGNAVLVRTARHSLLYDAGPRFGRAGDSGNDAGQRVLVPLLRALGERIDTLVLSHRDADHTGGAPAVLAMQPRAALLSSIESAHELQALRPARRCMAGQRWQWDGVDFELLHPQPADYEGGDAGRLKPNAVSCVLRIGNGRAALLLAGDIEAAQEARLLARRAPLAADVLLVPHHGSKTSSSAAFLDAVAPRIALAQSGYRNRFGHPAAEVVQRYRERGIRWVGSVECGAARWTSERPDVVECERESRRRYWQH